MSNPQKKRRFARTFIRVLTLPAGLLLLTILGFAVWVLLPDSAPPDDQNMLPQWDTSLARNPLAEFQVWLENHGPLPDRATLPNWSAPDAWSNPKARAAIAAASKALEQFRRLIAQADQPWQWREQAALISVVPSTDQLQEFMHLIRLQGIESRRAAVEGQTSRSLVMATQLLIFGQKLHESRGTIHHAFVGSSAISTGLLLLNELLADPDSLSSAELEALADSLNRVEPEPSTLLFVLQCEYAIFDEQLKTMGSADSAYFRMNESLTLYLERIQPVAEASSQGWKAALSAVEAAQEQTTSLFEGSLDGPLKFFHRNAIGKILVDVSAPGTHSVIDHFVELSYEVRETQLRVTRIRYERENGHPPKTQADLVPDYLPKIILHPETETPLTSGN